MNNGVNMMQFSHTPQWTSLQTEGWNPPWCT